ncbi:MAG TPA: CrcB family protein [Acidimicrobiales bacterium]|jgi:CrcB protein|nr:CrcB family protein [Acidimicrobiales bacterium]
MDQQRRPAPDDDASSVQPYGLSDDAGASDLLDQPVLPILGLSAGTLAAVFIGGALGTVARYLLEAHHPTAPGTFPWVTVLVNLTGSLAIGLLIPLTERAATRTPLLRPVAVVGFLGGWTTYSTLAVEATLLAKHGDVALSLAYLVATVAGGLALVVLGHAAGRRFTAA